MRRIGCVGLVAGLALTAGASGSSFQRGIFSIGLDGRGLRTLTSGPYEYSYPAVSPDGRLIAYSRGDSIWLMNAQGKTERRLAGVSNAWALGWSRDGRTVAWGHGAGYPGCSGADRCPDFRLYTISRDGSNLRKKLDAGAPRWSPTGRRIVYEERYTKFGAGSIGTMTVGRNGRSVASGDVSNPCWLSDGRRIAFTRGTRVVVRLPDGRKVAVGRGVTPACAPVGSRIAWTEYGGSGLYVGGVGLRPRTLSPAACGCWIRCGHRTGA